MVSGIGRNLLNNSKTFYAVAYSTIVLNSIIGIVPFSVIGPYSCINPTPLGIGYLCKIYIYR